MALKWVLHSSIQSSEQTYTEDDENICNIQHVLGPATETVCECVCVWEVWGCEWKRLLTHCSVSILYLPNPQSPWEWLEIQQKMELGHALIEADRNKDERRNVCNCKWDSLSCGYKRKQRRHKTSAGAYGRDCCFISTLKYKEDSHISVV